MARKPADQSVNRETILLAAAEVLRVSGYEATTMKDIASRVNLTAASLYHHFKNKDFLLLEVLVLGLERTLSQLEPIAHAPLNAGDRLRAMITTHIVHVTENPTVGAAMVFEIRALANTRTVPRHGGQVTAEDYAMFESERAKFFRQRDHFEALFQTAIREGIASGEFRAVDASIVTKAMLGAQNWVGVWYRGGGRLGGEQIAAVIADTFLASLQVGQGILEG